MISLAMGWKWTLSSVSPPYRAKPAGLSSSKVSTGISSFIFLLITNFKTFFSSSEGNYSFGESGYSFGERVVRMVSFFWGAGFQVTESYVDCSAFIASQLAVSCN